MDHIHGLGINPADGELYVGSHFGLFRVPGEGSPTLVSPVQDFMGFTVAGPDRFLSSGHPGEGQGGPSSLGLIESTDGGESWRTLSLSGDADFHSLELTNETIYALNSMAGTLMVSRGGGDWETLSSSPLADLAANPTTVDELVATSEEGPVRSTDGGSTFQPLSGAPLLLLVDWTQDGTLFGVSPDGSVHASDDSGATWEARGRLAGPPEALFAQDKRTVYAAAEGTVWESTDGGSSFRPRPTSP